MLVDLGLWLLFDFLSNGTNLLFLPRVCHPDVDCDGLQSFVVVGLRKFAKDGRDWQYLSISAAPPASYFLPEIRRIALTEHKAIIGPKGVGNFKAKSGQRFSRLAGEIIHSLIHSGHLTLSEIEITACLTLCE